MTQCLSHVRYNVCVGTVSAIMDDSKLGLTGREGLYLLRAALQLQPTATLYLVRSVLEQPPKPSPPIMYNGTCMTGNVNYSK